MAVAHGPVGPDTAVAREATAPLGHRAGPLRIAHDRTELFSPYREELRPVVADGTAQPPRRHPTTDPSGFFEHDHAASRSRQFGRSQQAGDSGPDDEGVK